MGLLDNFWGMGREGKDAQARLRDLANRNFGQFNTNLDRDESEYQWGRQLRPLASDHYKDLINNGFGDPGQARATGQEIMPIASTLASRRGRLNDIGDMAGGLTPAQGTMDLIGSNIDAFGEASTALGGNQQDLIGGTYRGMNRAREGVHSNVVDNIRDNYTGVRDNTAKSYAGLRRDNEGTYGGLQTGSGNAFDEAQGGVNTYKGTLDKLRPAGEFAAARAQRSFQPAMASAMQRLRRGGIDANSPQANAALSRIESARGRAMDDAFAGDANAMADREERLLDRNTGLTLGRQDAQERLALGRLGGERDLQREGTAIDNDVSLRAGDEYRNQLRSNLGQENALNLDYRDQQMANNERGFNRMGQYTGMRNDQALMGRDLQRQDFDLMSNLKYQMNDEDLLGLDLENAQFDRGTDWMGRNRAAQAAGAAGIDNQSNAAFSNSRGYGNQAGQYGQAAGQGFNQIEQREAANAGWGKKLLGGVAGAAADYFAPGSGQFIRGATGSGGFTGGGGYAGAPFGGARTPSWNPNLPRGINPGQMQPNGTFRLSR